MANRFLALLAIAFAGVWTWSAIHPAIPEDWWLENILVFFLIALLSGTYRWFTFSRFSYFLIFLLLCIHEAGAHYQYSDVPAGEWLKQLVHTDRNHYDRIVHFAFGLLLWNPQKELLERKGKVNETWAMWLSLIITLALSASYEIIEAITASTVDPTDAAAFLGLQGDPWDSQKDMFMGLAGAAVAMGTAFSVRTIRRVRVRRGPT
jgi:putative membrane protein